jgi:energy-coupling factor transporter ATP-binding protein EcfA2
MKQKLVIACGLLRPRALIFDEPLTGSTRASAG